MTVLSNGMPVCMYLITQNLYMKGTPDMFAFVTAGDRFWGGYRTLLKPVRRNLPTSLFFHNTGCRFGGILLT
jgi:hypothetical protein